MSDKKCCVPGCVNSQGKGSCVLHVFPNPEKYRQLFNSWIMAIGGDVVGLTDKMIYKYRRVCHSHFETKYWCRNNRIVKTAMPTLNMPDPLTCQKFTSTERRSFRPKENLAEHIVPLSTSTGMLGNAESKNVDVLPGHFLSTNSASENVEDVNMTGSRDNETGSDKAETEDDEIQLINDEEALVPKPIMDVLSKTELTSFRCDACLAVISGVRYHCMQCSDVDFCSECEARGNHDTHYMLRVPQYKPLAEVRSVLTAVQRALDSALAAAQELITIKDELDLKQEEDSETNCDPLLDPLSEPIFCNTNQENNDHKSVTDFNESNADSDSGEDMIRVYDNSDETNDLFVQSDHSEGRVVLPVKNIYKRKCVETKKTDHCFMGTDDDVIVEMYEEIRDTNLVFTNEDEYNILQLHQALTPISVGEPQKKRTRQS